MRFLVAVALLGLLVAGCAPRPGASRSNDESKSDNPDIANVAPEGRLTETVPNEANPALPAVTANPPPIVLTPIQGNTPGTTSGGAALPGDWRTFTSTVLGVRVNYPSDWSVAEEADGATFTSPNGATIQLKSIIGLRNSNEFRIGNQACTSRTNEHGQTAQICVDNASFTYTANFSIRRADGSTEQISLVTKTRTVGDVFEAMFNSLEPTR